MVSKKLSKVLLIIYSLLLIWILLFKLPLSFSEVASKLEHPMRSINLIPFQGSMIVNGKIALNEIILNGVIFAPLGVLLGISAKKWSLLKKLGFIFLFSLFIESMQFILGIGATDSTDLLMNFAGGLLGVILYQGLKQVISEEKLDRRLIIIGTLIGILCFGMVLLLILLNR
ncbi:VanZ family protein [Candidatus Enterococcus murrayae]|uniref:VanZ family protein n=1 Tax=Candidatus Enterococcus murrayae TaxID=2815321 RepID=A0ABS3HC80_9ENTE|nr:VanZ family protein [Enterococcus sp. MJM16]MBO0451061.1 VanZ family protein [Enterococcus sp. MJM16]